MSTITLKLSANSVQLIGIATFNNHNIKYNIQVILPLIRSCMSSTLFSSGVGSGGLGGPFAPPPNNFLMGGGQAILHTLILQEYIDEHEQCNKKSSY